MKQILIILIALLFASVASAQFTLTSNEKKSLVFNDQTEKFDLYQTESSETFWRIKDDVLLFNGMNGTKTYIITDFAEADESFNMILKAVNGQTFKLVLDLVNEQIVVMYYVEESLYLDIYPIVNVWE